MSSNKKKSGFRLGLTLKISLMIILISTLAAGITSVLNYQKYLDAVYTVYVDFAQGAGEEIASVVPAETWREYIAAIDAFRNDETDEAPLYDIEYSDEYQEFCEKIQFIVDCQYLRNVSIFSVDQPQMQEITEASFDPEESYYITFMMDFYRSDAEEEYIYEFGDSDIWWDDFDGFDYYRQTFADILETGDNWWMTEQLNETGVLLTDYYPIMDGDEVIAIIMLSNDAIEINDFMHSFFIESLLTALGITLALTLLAVLVMIFRVVRPLQAIRTDAGEFIANKAEISDRLTKIRTHDEIQDLAGSVLQMEQDIRDYISQVAAVTAEKERIHTELKLATRIQTNMLPSIFPPFPDRKEFSVYANSNPAKEVGGDFYDFFFVDENRLALVIADVAGKGVPAALFMTIAKALIKNRAQMGGTPAEILFDVNHQLCGESVESLFVTVWMAIVDLTTGDGIAANAGHEHPIRRNAGGTYELLKYRHSVPVATMDEMRFREHSFHLDPGDRIFVYTDGLPEAINTRGEEYGTDRLITLLNANPDLPFEALLKKVTNDVEAFAEEEPQFDDLTMLIFDYYGKE